MLQLVLSFKSPLRYVLPTFKILHNYEYTSVVSVEVRAVAG